MTGNFFAYFDHLRYPQPVVAETINARLEDLNQYRKRGLIMNSEWKYDGRVEYTGRGLIFAGIVAELAGAIGPKLASRVAEDLINYVSDIVDGRKNSWQDDMLILGWVGEGELVPQMVKEGDFKNGFTPNHAQIVIPIGHLIDMWSKGAEARMAAD